MRALDLSEIFPDRVVEGESYEKIRCDYCHNDDVVRVLWGAAERENSN